MKLIKGAAVAGLLAMAISLGMELMPVGPRPDIKMLAKVHAVIGLVGLVPWGILCFSALRFAPCLLAYLAVVILSMATGWLGLHRNIYVSSVLWIMEAITLAGTLLAMAKTNPGSVRKGLWILFAAALMLLVMFVFNMAGMSDANRGGLACRIYFSIGRIFSYLMRGGMLVGWLFLLVDSSTKKD